MACKHCHDHCDSHEHEGHEHHHEHDHEHENSKIEKYLLFAAIVLGASALVLDIFGINKILVAVLSGIAIILSGYEVFAEGVKSAIKLRIDETTLMSIAVIAAFALGEFVEGAMVTILFGIGETLEDKAVESSRRSIEKLTHIQAETANLIENGVEKTVKAEDVHIGSEIIIKPFEKVPLDCVITEGKTFADASAITGESLPVERSEGSELLSGMINGENLITAKTTKAFDDSTATRIIRLVEEASAAKSKNEKLISRFAAVYTPIVVLIALGVAFIPPIFLGGLSTWIYRGLVCLVASCPCAIVISVPLAYYSGIGAASKTGVLIKGGRYLESLAKCDTIMFDKTGTLTEGKPEITDIIPAKNYSADYLIKLAASAERYSSHPIARAIVEKLDGDFLPMSDYEEISGSGVSARLDGKLVRVGGKKLLTNGEKTEGSVVVTVDGELAGSIKIADKIRAEAKKVIRSLGIKNRMILTGDNNENAEKTAQALGLEFRANLLPQDKLNLVNEAKKNGFVTFVGDGINDAPVLAASDCGFAMGLGSDAAIASADAVLSSGNLKALPKAFTIARKTVATVKVNLVFALFVKALVMVLAAFGIAAIWMGVVADTGVCMLCVLYSTRLLKIKY